MSLAADDHSSVTTVEKGDDVDPASLPPVTRSRGTTMMVAVRLWRRACGRGDAAAIARVATEPPPPEVLPGTILIARKPPGKPLSQSAEAASKAPLELSQAYGRLFDGAVILVVRRDEAHTQALLLNRRFESPRVPPTTWASLVTNWCKTAREARDNTTAADGGNNGGVERAIGGIERAFIALERFWARRERLSADRPDSGGNEDSVKRPHLECLGLGGLTHTHEAWLLARDVPSAAEALGASAAPALWEAAAARAAEGRPAVSPSDDTVPFVLLGGCCEFTNEALDRGVERGEWFVAARHTPPEVTFAQEQSPMCAQIVVARHAPPNVVFARDTAKMWEELRAAFLARGAA